MNEILQLSNKNLHADLRMSMKLPMNMSSMEFALAEHRIEERMIYISPYSIINKIGYPIKVQSFRKNDLLEENKKDNSAFTILDSKPFNYQIHSDLKELYDSWVNKSPWTQNLVAK